MACASSDALSMRTSFTLWVRLDDACPTFLGFAKGWKGNLSRNSTRLPFLCSVEASEHWALAPLTRSSQSLTSFSLLIICANALMTGSTEGAGGGISEGGVTARGRPGTKDVGLGFPICCGADPLG